MVETASCAPCGNPSIAIRCCGRFVFRKTLVLIEDVEIFTRAGDRLIWLNPIGLLRVTDLISSFNDLEQ
jgi:hypothetical protein